MTLLIRLKFLKFEGICNLTRNERYEMENRNIWSVKTLREKIHLIYDRLKQKIKLLLLLVNGRKM